MNKNISLCELRVDELECSVEVARDILLVVIVYFNHKVIDFGGEQRFYLLCHSDYSLDVVYCEQIPVESCGHITQIKSWKSFVDVRRVSRHRLLN